MLIVDVIVPVHNQFEYVRGCLRSILHAKCSTQFEVVVIDDASSDERLKDLLRSYHAAGAISLHVNPVNLGYTRTTNLGMRLHTDRDVLLLNSDTIVYDGWLDRIVKGAYSDDRVATVNPMTGTTGSHISCYPYPVMTSGVSLEVSDENLNMIAQEVNDGRSVMVPSTVGFCMYIKRACLDDIGYFDAVNFPIAYGEESDACYRARKTGWSHLVVGDVFVSHLEGKSFGEKKAILMNEMFEKFRMLHPEVTDVDANFRRTDPLRALRSRLDLGRLKRLRNFTDELRLHVVDQEGDATNEVCDFSLVYVKSQRQARIRGASRAILPNLETYDVPFDTMKFNKHMEYLGVRVLRSASDEDRQTVEKAFRASLVKLDSA